MIAWNRYGKSRIRLVKVRRSRDVHDLVDLTLDVQLEGDFEPVYGGDNALCVATDTMKNTVYAFARREPLDRVEPFALRLAEHFIAKPAVTRARITAAEHPWVRLAANGRPHPHAFARDGSAHWTAAVLRDARGTTVSAGLADLVLLKTAHSAFSGFPRDEYTTLPDTGDRILATSLTATWTYRDAAVDFGARDRIRTVLVEAFAVHESQSVQHTLAAMGQAALGACPEIVEISLAMPNRHHLLVDLAPFGLDNPNDVFVATDQPFGLIEATLRR